MPTGVQEHVAEASVLAGGRSIYYSASYGASLGTDPAAALKAAAATSGYTDVMLAGMVTGSGMFDVLADAPLADVVFDTGRNANVTHQANGVGWYYAPNYSWGFAGGGESVSKGQCDINAGADRLCWHTIAGVGGYRDGAAIGLNDSTKYTKLILVHGERLAVPEPSTLALVGAGLLCLVPLLRGARKLR